MEGFVLKDISQCRKDHKFFIFPVTVLLSHFSLRKPTNKNGICHGSKSQMSDINKKYGSGKMKLMDKREIEPGLLTVFRYYCGFSQCYFLGNFLYLFYTANVPISSTSLLYLVNFFIFFFLLIFLLLGWLKNRLKGLFLPIAIIVATLAPIYTSTLLWPSISQDPLTDIIYRSWMLFPILIVPIVLVAWQYNLIITLALVVLTAFYDLPAIVQAVGDKMNLDAVPFIGVPILRSIALGIVGTIVYLLMKTQRMQRERLMEANIILSEHTQTLEQLAVSRERNRLARELHDTLAHTLSSQILTLEALRLTTEPEDKELNDALDKLIANTREGLSDTRRALKDLRAKQLEDLGLASALKSLIADAASRTSCSATCTISENLPLFTPKAEQCMYRIAQEAVENIIRHANATTMELKLINTRKQVILEISDDGEGFSQSEVDNTEKMGIKGMHERAAEAGGTFSLETMPNEGTKVSVIFKD